MSVLFSYLKEQEAEVPIYEYKCCSCSNEFEELLSLDEYSPLRVCPECNAPSTRKLSAPQLAILKKNERIARDRNERAKYEPLKVTRKHKCDHSSCDHEEKKKGVFQQIREGTRPWMLG